MKTFIAVLALLVAVYAGYLFLHRNEGVWELRVEKSGKTLHFQGFKTEEECYAFYDEQRRGQEFVHGCYPLR
jgi:hypothetical protein